MSILRIKKNSIFIFFHHFPSFSPQPNRYQNKWKQTTYTSFISKAKSKQAQPLRSVSSDNLNQKQNKFMIYQKILLKKQDGDLTFDWAIERERESKRCQRNSTECSKPKSLKTAKKRNEMGDGWVRFFLYSMESKCFPFFFSLLL
jgi:hypothetical protein